MVSRQTVSDLLLDKKRRYCWDGHSHHKSSGWPLAAWIKKALAIACKGFLFGSSTWARTKDLRINRKPGSSKTHINHRLTCIFDKRVIIRVITKKYHNVTFWTKQSNFGSLLTILRSSYQAQVQAWRQIFENRKLLGCASYRDLAYKVSGLRSRDRVIHCVIVCNW